MHFDKIIIIEENLMQNGSLAIIIIINLKATLLYNFIIIINMCTYNV